MIIRFPTNDDDRISVLRALVEQADADHAINRQIISRWRRNKVAAFMRNYDKVLWDVRQRAEEQTTKLHEVKSTIEALRKLTLTIWKDLAWKLRWEEINPEMVEYYGLDRQGRMPNIRNRQELLRESKKILTGDLHAQAKGLPPIESRDELLAAYEAAKFAVVMANEAKYGLASARAELANLRRQYNRFYTRAVADLKAEIVEMTPAQQGQILDNYGVDWYDAKSASKSNDVPDDNQSGADVIQVAGHRMAPQSVGEMDGQGESPSDLSEHVEESESLIVEQSDGEALFSGHLA